MRTPPPTRLSIAGAVLRALGPEHEGVLGAALTASDAHLRPWTPWVVDGKVTGQTLRERLARHAESFVMGTEWVYGIFAEDAPELLGGCGLYPRVGPRAVEIGYWLAVRATGRGLATRAARALTRVAFASSDIDVVEIRCDPRNVASARVPARLGYRVAASPVDALPASLQIWRLPREEFLTGIAGDVD